MCDWEGCTTGMIGLPNPDQRSVAKTSGFPHPYIYAYTARASPLERILALRGEGIAWMGQPSRQGIVLVSARTEFWRSTGRDASRRRFRFVGMIVAGFLKPDTVMGTHRIRLAPPVLVHEMSLSPEQTSALDYKLGPHRLGRKAQNVLSRM